jgi:hypothetical protein
MVELLAHHTFSALANAVGTVVDLSECAPVAVALSGCSTARHAVGMCRLAASELLPGVMSSCIAPTYVCATPDYGEATQEENESAM